MKAKNITCADRSRPSGIPTPPGMDWGVGGSGHPEIDLVWPTEGNELPTLSGVVVIFRKVSMEGSPSHEFGQQRAPREQVAISTVTTRGSTRADCGFRSASMGAAYRGFRHGRFL